MPYAGSNRCRISRVRKVFAFLNFHQFRTAFGRMSSPDATNFPEILEIFENRPDQNRDISKTTSTFSKNFDVLESRWIALSSSMS